MILTSSSDDCAIAEI